MRPDSGPRGSKKHSPYTQKCKPLGLTSHTTDGDATSYAVPCPMPDSAKKTAVLISIYVNTIKHKITELESSTRTRTFIRGRKFLPFFALFALSVSKSQTRIRTVKHSVKAE